MGQGRTCSLSAVMLMLGGWYPPLLSPLSRWTGQQAQALNLHAGRLLAPGQYSHALPPVFSGAALVSVLLPAWFLLSGRAGVPPAPEISPAGCDSGQL